jgi:hypothetical protein
MFVYSCLRCHLGSLSFMEPLQRWPHRPAARQQLAPRLFDFLKTREGGVAVAQAGLHDAAAGLKYLKSDGVAADDDTETGLRGAKCKTKRFHGCFSFQMISP